VAVVSISRIQIRRGRRADLPQLASGEFGWAVDSQELYIGNGAVSEGAPYVGNTKLLTENDDLFQFSDNYSYKKTAGYLETGESPNLPITRSLQERLDDTVSIRSFGGTGDGTDHTKIIQRAIDQLYLNAANKGQSQSRVELFLEAGEYLITDTIYLPPFVNIKGAGSNKTIITANMAKPAFQTVNENSTVGSYADDSTSTFLNQSRNISFTGCTINTNGWPAFVLQTCRDSLFQDLNLAGNWNLGDASNTNNTAIKMNILSTAVTCSGNLFSKINITNFSHAVLSDDDIVDNDWSNCSFKNLRTGFVFGLNTLLGTTGQLTGPSKNTIKNSRFDNIMETAVHIIAGRNNLSDNNFYYSVGYEGGTPENSRFPVIDFEDLGNRSTNDYFERAELLGFDSLYLVNTPYIEEVAGFGITEMNVPHVIDIGEFGEPTRIFRLPARDDVKSYQINYIYKSSTVEAYRTGELEVITDPINNSIELTDSYTFIGDSTVEENLSFSAVNSDEDADNNIDTIAILMLNSTSGDIGRITYTVTYKS